MTLITLVTGNVDIYYLSTSYAMSLFSVQCYCIEIMLPLSLVNIYPLCWLCHMHVHFYRVFCCNTLVHVEAHAYYYMYLYYSYSSILHLNIHWNEMCIKNEVRCRPVSHCSAYYTVYCTSSHHNKCYSVRT